MPRAHGCAGAASQTRHNPKQALCPEGQEAREGRLTASTGRDHNFAQERRIKPSTTSQERPHVPNGIKPERDVLPQALAETTTSRRERRLDSRATWAFVCTGCQNDGFKFRQLPPIPTSLNSALRTAPDHDRLVPKNMKRTDDHWLRP